jgi:hypothetical protein
VRNLGYYFSSNLVFYAGKCCFDDSELEVVMHLGVKEKKYIKLFLWNQLENIGVENPWIMLWRTE